MDLQEGAMRKIDTAEIFPDDCNFDIVVDKANFTQFLLGVDDNVGICKIVNERIIVGDMFEFDMFDYLQYFHNGCIIYIDNLLRGDTNKNVRYL